MEHTANLESNDRPAPLQHTPPTLSFNHETSVPISTHEAEIFDPMLDFPIPAFASGSLSEGNTGGQINGSLGALLDEQNMSNGDVVESALSWLLDQDFLIRSTEPTVTHLHVYTSHSKRPC